MSINLEGGVTSANLLDTLALWESVLREYVRFIGWV